jgi:hypothetical protein
MAFWRGDHCVHWRGTYCTTVPHLAITTAPDLLQLLLAEFAILFLEPTGLQLGTPPVAVRHYRYPQLLKDEIENQCTTMLAQRIIHASTFPFSSPVLLVRKPDDKW